MALFTDYMIRILRKFRRIHTLLDLLRFLEVSRYKVIYRKTNYISICQQLSLIMDFFKNQQDKQKKKKKPIIHNIHWIIEKSRKIQKKIYLCFIDYAKALDCVDHKKLWKILQEMGIPDHLPCLLRNLYAGQEATVKTGYRTTD